MRYGLIKGEVLGLLHKSKPTLLTPTTSRNWQYRLDGGAQGLGSCKCSIGHVANIVQTCSHASSGKQFAYPVRDSIKSLPDMRQVNLDQGQKPPSAELSRSCNQAGAGKSGVW